MNTQQMRNILSVQYGDSWKKRVAKMSDAQIVAIFYRMQREGKLFYKGERI